MVWFTDRSVEKSWTSPVVWGSREVENVATGTAQKAVHLNEGSDGRVVLTTEESDRFIRTQREVVSAMRGADDILARGRKLSDDFGAMIQDIQAWCKRQPSLAFCTLCPRIDDVLAVMVASDDDEEGALDDAISSLDLEMFGRNKFRITWLMLRASEAAGISSFVQSQEARIIYRAQ